MTTRRLGLLALLPLVCALTACGTNSDALRLEEILYHQLTASFEENSVPRAHVVAIPYATLGVRLGSGTEALVVLTNISQQDLQWIGGTAISLITRNGRIIRTVGLGHDLSGFQGPIPDRSDGTSAQSTYHYIYDLIDRNAYGVVVRCTQSDIGGENIVIIGLHHDTRHIVERCEAKQLDWTFQNEFWTDTATGIVWRSTQYIHPDLDPLTIQVLRPNKG